MTQPIVAHKNDKGQTECLTSNMKTETGHRIWRETPADRRGPHRGVADRRRAQVGANRDQSKVWNARHRHARPLPMRRGNAWAKAHHRSIVALGSFAARPAAMGAATS